MVQSLRSHQFTLYVIFRVFPVRIHYHYLMGLSFTTKSIRIFFVILFGGLLLYLDFHLLVKWFFFFFFGKKISYVLSHKSLLLFFHNLNDSESFNTFYWFSHFIIFLWTFIISTILFVYVILSMIFKQFFYALRSLLFLLSTKFLVIIYFNFRLPI